MSSPERWQPTRDFLGYGEKAPDPKWPNGARLAVNFVMNYEEGSEPSVQDGEGYTETGLTESTSSAVGMMLARDLSCIGRRATRRQVCLRGHRRVRSGLWRALRSLSGWWGG